MHLISQSPNAQTSDLRLLTHSLSWPTHKTAQCNVDGPGERLQRHRLHFQVYEHLAPHLHGRTRAKRENCHQMQRRGRMFAFGMGGPSEVWRERKWCGTVGRGTTRCNINERTHHLLLLIYQYMAQRGSGGENADLQEKSVCF